MTDMRTIAGAALSRVGRPVFGLVSAVDPVNHAIKARVQPDDVETGWMPMPGVMVGNLRIGCLPDIGAHVVLGPIEGDQENLVPTGIVFDSVVMPPTSPATGKPAQPGELLIMAGCGAPPAQDGGANGAATQGAPWWHLTPSTLYAGAGSVRRALSSSGEVWTIGGMTLTINTSGLTVQGGSIATDQNVTAQGNMTAQGTITGQQDVKTGQHSLNGHVHTNGNKGSNTGGPVG